MKLLFVHQHFGAWGGAEANIQITANELQRRGHEVALLHADSTGRGEESWAKTFEQRVVLPAGNRAEAVRESLARFAPDLVYLHTLPDLEVISVLVASPVPVIRMVHDHSIYCLRGYKYNPLTRKPCTRAASWRCVFPCMASLTRSRSGFWPVKLASLNARRKEIAATRRCRRAIVYSDYSKMELVRNGFDERRIHVHVPLEMPSGTAASSFSERNLILWAGQIIRGKGLDLLLRALARVSVPFECLVFGEGNHRASCEELRSKLGLAGRVQFRGFVPPAEMEQFYLQGSLFTISSVWPEPFGMVGPEAMRFGLPVVGFDAGGIREWLIDGENGFLVPWKDISRYAARIEQLLQDKRLARQLGECGRERVTAVYSASAQVSRLENIFQEVLEESPGPIAAGTLERRTPDTVAIPRFVEPCLRVRETAIQDTAPAIQHAL